MKLACALMVFVIISCNSKEKTHSYTTNKKITSQVIPSLQNERETVPFNHDSITALEKSTWGRRNGPGTFLYSKKVDRLVTEQGFLNDSTIESFSEQQLIYYCLAYPGNVGQTCTAYPEDGGTIFLTVAMPMDNRVMNQAQIKALEGRKDRVGVVLKKVLSRKTYIDIEYLRMVVEANLVQLIPILCKKADLKRNHFIYSALIELMEKNRYSPYMNGYYDRLRENILPNGFEIHATKKEEEKIKEYAMRFYHDS